MTNTTRRTFLTGAVAAAGIALAQPETSGGAIKMGLYSITYAGLWYRGRALSLEEVVDRAVQYGYHGVEIGGKRPHGNPLDMPKARCRQLAKYAADKGIEIFAVAGNNDFSSPIPEHRECQIVYTRELMRMASDLGAKILRVFLGWPGVTKVPGQGGSYEHARKVYAAAHEGFTEEQIWDWCREGLRECTRYAREYGVTMALQNHKPVIKDYRDVLRMVKEVDSPNLKVVLDAPLMDDKSEAAMRTAAFAVGALQTTSHFGGEYHRDASGKVASKGSEIYPYFVRAMLDIGYRGYVSYELCHRLPVVNGNTVGLEYPEQSAQLAAEFMRGVIADAEKAPRRKTA
jgi:sugar phosphate isomerase/epimerase